MYTTLLIISSEIENISKLESIAEDVVVRAGFSQEKMPEILIALTEAVTNAITHGNKKKSEKKVEIQFELQEDTISLLVKDEGEGFDFNYLKDPRATYNLGENDGRGVLIIRELADDFFYHDGGRTIELIFRDTNDKKAVSFFTEDLEFNLESEDKYVHWLQEISSYYGKTLDFLNYIFTSDRNILAINQQYLEHDYYTDIISFPMSREPISGDIFISIDRVKDNAERMHVAFSDELLRVMAHGLLHFIGYDDHTEGDEREMRKQEERCIALFKSLD